MVMLLLMTSSALVRDGLPFERGIEIDCVTVMGIDESLTQRARAAIVGVDDRYGRRVDLNCDCVNQ